MLRNLRLALLIGAIILWAPCTSYALLDRLVSGDPAKSQAGAGDYLMSQFGNNRILFNRDFTYTTMTYSNRTRDFDSIMTFSLFDLNQASRSSLKDQSETLQLLFLNATGMYVRSSRGNVYELTSALVQAAGFRVNFVAAICTEEPSLNVYVGDEARSLYYPETAPIVPLGTQFITGVIPRSNRQVLCGYSFRGSYHLKNDNHNFCVFFSYDESTASCLKTSSIRMSGLYRGANYSQDVDGLPGSSAGISFGARSNGTYTVVDDRGVQAGKWRSERLPVCRELRGYNFLTLYMETYAPFVGLYNEGGQLLWKFGRITDCSLTRQFEYMDVCLDECPEPLFHDYFTWRCRVRCSSDLMVYYQTRECKCGCSDFCHVCGKTEATCASCQPSIPNRVLALNQTCVARCDPGQYVSRQDEDNWKCLMCSSNCRTCENSAVNCLSCNAGMVLQENLCVEARGSVTLVCGAMCRTCSGSASTCTSCFEGLFLFNLTCVVSCPRGYYWTESRVCERCHPACPTCQSRADYCTSCPPQLVLFREFCLETVPENVYFELSSSSYSICHGNCRSCSAYTACTKCYSGQVLARNSTCVAECPPGEYANVNSTCAVCARGCLTCEVEDTYCRSCAAGLFLTWDAKCRAEFADGELLYLGAIAKCVSQCRTCSGRPSQCTSCFEPNYLLNGSCTRSIAAGYYAERYSLFACHPNCRTCAGWATACLSCQSGTPYLELTGNSTGNCLAKCPITSYDMGFSCVRCSPNCLGCERGKTSVCTSCRPGQTLSGSICIRSTSMGAAWLCPENCLKCTGQVCEVCDSLYLVLNGRCVDRCPDSFYNLNMTHCQACIANCKTCLRQNVCSSCNPNGYLTKTFQCVSICPKGTFPAGSSCADCPDATLECLNSTYALLCRPGSLVSTSNMCVRQCSPGESRNATHCSLSLIAFGNCAAPCKTCAYNQTYCTSCLEGSGTPYLNAFTSTCVAQCLSNEYLSGSTCRQCYPNCKTCVSSPSTCTSCAQYSPQPYLSTFGTCVSTCSKGEISNRTHCLKCSTNCASCAGRPEVCTSCAGIDGCDKSYLTLQSTCVCQCPRGEFSADGIGCARCSSVCAACDGNSRKCTGCDSQSPYPYFLKSQWSCLAACPPSHFASAFECAACAEECSTCSVAASNCTSCSPLKPGRLLSLNRCVSSCPAGAYEQDLACLPCVAPCLECVSSPTFCLSCQSGVLSNGKCAEKCPAQFYGAGGKCEKCLANCRECSGAGVCTRAMTGYFVSSAGLVTEQCQTDEYVADATVCAKCDVSCATCVGSRDNCLTCPPTLLFSKATSRCVSKCEANEYPSNKACLRCKAGCLTCGNSASCTLCDPFLPTRFLFGGECV